MRVLVTGGRGDLGGRLVPELLAQGHDVVVGTRHASATASAPGEVPYVLDADPRPALRGTDTVIHLASDATDPALDRAATERLVSAATAEGVGHLIYMSIVGIDDNPFPYYRTKLAAERALQAGAVPWTIQRATQFHSFVERIGHLLRRGPVMLVPSGFRVQPVDADAVAGRLAELVAAGPSGRVQDIGGPQVIGLAAALRALVGTGRLTGRVVSVPLPGRTAAAFRRGANLLGPGGAVIGASFDEYVASLR